MPAESYAAGVDAVWLQRHDGSMFARGNDKLCLEIVQCLFRVPVLQELFRRINQRAKTLERSDSFRIFSTRTCRRQLLSKRPTLSQQGTGSHCFLKPPNRCASCRKLTLASGRMQGRRFRLLLEGDSIPGMFVDEMRCHFFQLCIRVLPQGANRLEMEYLPGIRIFFDQDFYRSISMFCAFFRYCCRHGVAFAQSQLQ